MPGGVDIHAHIAGPKVNSRAQAVARRPPRRSTRPHRAAALGHRRPGPVHVRHRLPLLAAGLHHRRRGGRAAAGRPPRALRAARHADDRQGVPDPDGQQPGAVRADPRVRRRSRGGRGPDQGRGRLVAAGDRRLRGQAREPRRRRAVEAEQRRRRVDRRHGAGLRGDPAPGAGGDRRRRGRARAAASGPHPRQPPRRPGQRRHHAGHDARARRAPGALRPPPVPLLRGQARGSAALPGARAASSTCPSIPRSPRTSAR